MTKTERLALAKELAARTEARRVRTLATLTGEAQATLGQFFTPEVAAALIADLPRLPKKGRLRVLDPGAGTGSLSAAVAARLLAEGSQAELELVAVEVDPQVVERLAETLRDIRKTFAGIGLKATTTLVPGDYIELTTGMLDRREALDKPFDLVIMNPPYRKLASKSAHRRALSMHGAETPNLYAAFLALGTTALETGGQLVAITPRSFANGTYFGQFRRFMLDRLALDRLHVFESRSTVFSDTGVLQENVVFSATRDGKRDSVMLSVSHGHTDVPSLTSVPYDSVVEPNDKEHFIRIPAGAEDSAIASEMAALPAALKDLGIKVSTGRVVDFRSIPCLKDTDQQGAYPLIYPGNVRGGVVEWPREIRKAQWFLPAEAADEKLLMPEGNYVLVKRFSSKEERRRLVAAVWDDTRPGAIAFENHLNVFHANGTGLDHDLAIGLSYWLNSTFVDKFFRTFSGHTQVNAGDLRSLRFPSASDLRLIGKRDDAELPGQDDIDNIIAEAIGIGSMAA